MDGYFPAFEAGKAAWSIEGELFLRLYQIHIDQKGSND